MQNSFNKFYNDYKKRTGVKVLIDTKEDIVFFKEIKDNNLNSIDCKYMFADYGHCKQGSLIKVNNNYYIATQKEENLNNNNCYEKFTIRQAPHLLKMYINNKLQEIPAIIETGTQDIWSNQYISLPTGNIKVTVQDNDIIKKMQFGTRFIKMRNVWNIIEFTSENKGLQYLYCKKDGSNGAYDDMENEIADRWKYEVKHEYSINIVEDNISIEEGQTKQIVISVTDTVNGNTINVANPNIIYISLDNNVATIDNKGLIKGIKEGKGTIKVQFENISKQINISVNDTIQSTIIITGKTSLALGRITSYSSNIPVNWSVENEPLSNGVTESTPYATMNAFSLPTDTKFSIKATSTWIFKDDYSRYFNIIAVSKEDSNVKSTYKVKITAY